MSDAELDHALVRAYLRELDDALASLPSERAAELRDQIAGHLAEELQPAATEHDVAEAIRRMGTPADLAREAGARRTLRAVLKRRSWRFWTITAAVIAAAGVGIGLLVSVQSAPDLYSEGQSGWWYPQDRKHEVDTQPRSMTRSPFQSDGTSSRATTSSCLTSADTPRLCSEVPALSSGPIPQPRASPCRPLRARAPNRPTPHWKITTPCRYRYRRTKLGSFGCCGRASTSACRKAGPLARRSSACAYGSAGSPGPRPSPCRRSSR